MTAGGRGAFGKVSSARDKNLQTGRKSHPMTFKPFALACAAMGLGAVTRVAEDVVTSPAD